MIKKVICKEEQVPQKGTELTWELLESEFKSKGILDKLYSQTKRFPRVKKEYIGYKTLYYADDFSEDGVFVCSIEVKYDYLAEFDSYEVTVICEDKK